MRVLRKVILVPEYRSDLGASAGSGQTSSYNDTLYEQTGTAEADSFSVRRFASATGGTASLMRNSVTVDGAAGADQFFVVLEVIAADGGHAESSDNSIIIYAGDDGDGFAFRSTDSSRIGVTAIGPHSSATSLDDELFYSGGAGVDLHRQAVQGYAQNGGQVVINGTSAQMSGGEAEDFLQGEARVTAYGAGSEATLANLDVVLTGGDGGDRIDHSTGGDGREGGHVTVSGNYASIHGEAGSDALGASIYAGSFGGSAEANGNHLTLDSGSDGGTVNGYIMAYAYHDGVSSADGNSLFITGGEGADTIEATYWAYIEDFYDVTNGGTATLSNNSITVNAGSGSDSITVYFRADVIDYYAADNDEYDLSITRNSLIAAGGEGADTLAVYFVRSDVEGSTIINSDNSATLEGGADSDILYAELAAGSQNNSLTLDGGDGDDTLHSRDYGSNIRLFVGGAGNDFITDHLGQSTAQFSGARSDYSIVISNGVITVTDLRSGSPDGTDTLHGVDVLRFSNGDFRPDATNDFNGDGRSDILWRNDSGMVTNWLGLPDGSFVGNAANVWTAVSTDWHIEGTGDFNGDGLDDILWRDDSGVVTNWLGLPDGSFVGNAANVWTAVSTDWHIESTGDFNGDGLNDILWRNDSGIVTNWLGLPDGGFVGNAANVWTAVSTDWHIEGTGDFNRDGLNDILWRDDSGVVTNWLGLPDGSFVGNAANVWTAVSTDWHIEGIGDFNGDGRDDILWRNDNDVMTNWLGQANGGFVGNAGNAGALASPDWNIVGTDDYNGDGRDDILWRHDSGAITEWLGQANGRFLRNDFNVWVFVSTDWQVQTDHLL
jgi:hypothetical protein